MAAAATAAAAVAVASWQRAEAAAAAKTAAAVAAVAVAATAAAAPGGGRSSSGSGPGQFSQTSQTRSTFARSQHFQKSQENGKVAKCALGKRFLMILQISGMLVFILQSNLLGHF